jgi:KaiC/GvpD/RAD55 family RecA-like ATPase
MSSDSDRFATGVPGLDTILGGGVFDGGIYIIQGAPGAGKTILGNQICFAQAAQGRNALYITLLAESHARMIGHMRRLKFFDESAIPDRMSYVGAFKTLDDDGLRGLLDVVRREVRTRNASILVLDGLITVHEKAGSDLELKKFIHELQTQAAFSNCTMFLLTSAFDGVSHPPEHTMVDGLIELQSSLHGRRAERSLQVHKLRGSWFMGGKHSYRITENGHAIYPRVEALLETPSVWDSADGPMVSIGIAGVDAMFGGGVDTHSVTVVLGPSGSGKARGVRRLVIDGIEGFSKLTDEKGRVGSFLSAMCNELRALGVTTLATAETDHAGITPGQPLKGMNQTGLSAVAENIISLQLAALRSENHRLMTILKSRDRRTDMRMRRFEIGEGGIRLDDDYLRAEGILRDISNLGPAPAPSADLKLTGE